jgi:anti-anti-sigma factor
MKLKLLPLGGDTLFRLQAEGELDWRPDSEADDPLVSLLGPHCFGHKILLNLEHVPYINSGGVCWLLHAQKRFQEAGGKFVLYRVPPLVLDVLGVLHLTAMLCIADDAEGARALAETAEKSPPASSPQRPATP